MKVRSEVIPRENACLVSGTGETPAYNHMMFSVEAGSRKVLIKGHIHPWWSVGAGAGPGRDHPLNPNLSDSYFNFNLSMVSGRSHFNERYKSDKPRDCIIRGDEWVPAKNKA